MNNKQISIAAGVAAFFLSACDGTSGADVAAALSGPAESNFAGDPPAVQCYGERFVQPSATITKSVDLLFVTDTSGSLSDERTAIANGIDSFVAELPSDVDYRVAVMLAHGSTSARSGKLYKHGSSPAVMDSKTMTLAQIRTALRDNFTNTVDDHDTDGGEEGMFSFSRALDAPYLAASQALGFFRADAALAVVFVSDENDICAVYPAGVTPVPDPDGLEVTAKARDCAGITKESVLAKVRAIQGDRPLLIGGIVYSDKVNYPKVGENEYGYGYMDLIQLAHGIPVDMATGNYDSGLAEIGRMVTSKLNLNYDFTMNHPTVDPASVQVWVDGVSTTDFTFDESGQIVHVPHPGIAHSTIDVNYCQKCIGLGCGGGIGI